MKFVPSKSYDSLKKQAYALHTLATSMESELARLRAKDYKTTERQLNLLEESLESEREMNSILTQEIQKLEERIMFTGIY